MPIATPEQYRELIDAARDGSYAYPAVNVSSSETLNAAMGGFAAAGSDGIVQISTGGGEFASGGAVADMALGAKALVEYAHVLADRYPVLIVLHTDHCPPDKLDRFLLPLLAESVERRARGEEPLFGSHMFDGSSLPLEENLAIAAELLEQCAAADVILEVECGVVGGEEDGVSAEDTPREPLYTTTKDLLRVAEVLGTGEKGRYLLAATFGNVHGIYAPGNVKLRPTVLRDGQEALAAAYGASFDYVFHGGSGSDPEEIAEAVGYGVVKMNVDTDMQYAYTRAIAGHMFERYDTVLKVDGDTGDKKAYDPRVWGRKGEQAMAARVEQACHDLGSAGRSLAQRRGAAVAGVADQTA
jgi:fructose-bisphosphate aldolase, class II